MESKISDSAAALGKTRWSDSAARKLDSGILPAFSDELGPKEAWDEVYSKCQEF